MKNKINSKKISKKKRNILSDSPPINNLKELIELSYSIKFYNNINMIVLWRISPYLEELNKLIGMDNLKETIFAQILYYLQGLHIRNASDEYLHTMIYGPPGCGKTTVAKIIGKIYQSLGILSKHGKFRIAYRDDFIAGYLGQTSNKTQKLLKSCLGGVLFIDEIYSLAPKDSDRDSFSKEALDTLTSFLSEHKNDFCCIGAGYEEEIENCFFSMNQGLKRRFPWIHKIEIYSSKNLTDIFFKMIYDMNWNCIVSHSEMISFFDKYKLYFENTGGDIETFITKIKIEHAKRIINLSNDHKFILNSEDINKAIKLIEKTKKLPTPPPMGLYI
tara:strand:- start:298 stop:1290 length:993 start_codon:yes stop_codon:yes gene_type:complete